MVHKAKKLPFIGSTSLSETAISEIKQQENAQQVIKSTNYLIDNQRFFNNFAFEASVSEMTVSQKRPLHNRNRTQTT